MNGTAGFDTRLNEKGFAFVAVAILTFILFGLFVSYFDILLTEKKLTAASVNRLNAESIAEAGVEEVLWEYNYGEADFLPADGWAGSVSKVKTVNPFVAADGSTLGSFTVTVDAWDTLSPQITSIASALSSGTGKTATVKSGLEPLPIYSAAVRAKGAISLSGSAYTDSYDSTAGAYGGANLGQNGDVFTNSTAPSAISLSGGAVVQGDAFVGTGGGVSPTTSVTGTITAGVNEAMPDNTVPESLTALPSSGALSGTATISGGSYKYSDISLPGSGIVTIQGNVTLYLTSTSTAIDVSGNGSLLLDPAATLTIYTDGNISLSGNSLLNGNGSQSPTTLQIYGTPTCTAINVSSNAGIVGLISAPQAYFTISGNGGVYGGISVDQFTSTGNGGLHYDENLASNGPTKGFRLKWHRRII